LSHNFSKGKEPGDKNIKAILDIFAITGGEFKISLITTRDAISSSVYSLAGTGGSQSEKLLHPLEEKM
jgi:hypothetical protein